MLRTHNWSISFTSAKHNLFCELPWHKMGSPNNEMYESGCFDPELIRTWVLWLAYIAVASVLRSWTRALWSHPDGRRDTTSKAFKVWKKYLFSSLISPLPLKESPPLIWRAIFKPRFPLELRKALSSSFPWINYTNENILFGRITRKLLSKGSFGQKILMP